VEAKSSEAETVKGALIARRETGVFFDALFSAPPQAGFAPCASRLRKETLPPGKDGALRRSRTAPASRRSAFALAHAAPRLARGPQGKSPPTFPFR
jgi:hypothetical protein